MMDKLGTIQTNLAQKCCDENLQKEIDATIAKGNYEICGDRIGIVASGDAGWQGAGSRNTYNSISGHTLLVGGYTKLVLAFKFFSKICQTCSNLHKKYGNNFDVNLVPPHRCSKNWSDSSKAMEPNGLVDCAKQIWNSGKAWLKIFVSDDDSSSRAALKYTLEARMFLENLLEPPRGPDGKKLKDTGKLPGWMRIPTTFLVDPSHRRRVYGSYFYRLIARCRAFKKTDCEVLIRNFGYAMKQNRGKPMDEFKTAMNAGLYHQFNDHVHCSGEWCKYVHIDQSLWNEVNENNNNKLRNKVADEMIWNEAKAIHDLFVTDENLAMLNHEFDSQKNEALNKAFTKVAPKNMVFSKSHLLYDRLALVIVYDSIGLHECLTRILQLLLQKDNYILSPIKATWSKQQDKQRKNKKARESTPRCKGMRCAKRKAKLELERINNKRAKKNGDFYEHGHAFKSAIETSDNATVDENVVVVNTQPAATKSTVTVPVCKSCLRPGHKYRSSRQCGKNKYYLAALAMAATAKANNEGMVNENDEGKGTTNDKGMENPNNKE